MRLLHYARSNDKIKVQIWGESSGQDGTGQRNSVRESVMNEIFCNLLEKDLVIEINTSSLRKRHEQTMPGRELLEIYRSNGGKYATIGSDAHAAEDVGADYATAKELLKEAGLQEVIYRRRKKINEIQK